MTLIQHPTTQEGEAQPSKPAEHYGPTWGGRLRRTTHPPDYYASHIHLYTQVQGRVFQERESCTKISQRQYAKACILIDNTWCQESSLNLPLSCCITFVLCYVANNYFCYKACCMMTEDEYISMAKWMLHVYKAQSSIFLTSMVTILNKACHYPQIKVSYFIKWLLKLLKPLAKTRNHSRNSLTTHIKLKGFHSTFSSAGKNIPFKNFLPVFSSFSWFLQFHWTSKVCANLTMRNRFLECRFH